MEWMVLGLAMSALVAGVAGTMLGASKRGNAFQNRCEHVWREHALALGAEVITGPRSALSPRRLRMLFEHEGVRSIVEANVPVDAGAPSHTRAHAAWALGFGPAFRLEERSAGDRPRLAGVLSDDLERRARLNTDEPDAVAKAFSETAQLLAETFPRPLALRADSSGVTLLWDGVEVGQKVLRDAAVLVAELARHGLEGLRALSAVEGAEITFEPTGARIVVRRSAVTVALFATHGLLEPEYVAEAEMQRELESLDAAFSVVIADGAITGELPEGLLGPDGAEALRGVGEATLEGDEKAARLVWAASPSVAQAEAGVSLVAAIASGGNTRGAFR